MGASVAAWTAIGVFMVLAAVVAIGGWAIRHQNRTFPEGFDRTGWSPQGERAGWFRTKFTWLSGGRG
jgi:hypothetical protein